MWTSRPIAVRRRVRRLLGSTVAVAFVLGSAVVGPVSAAVELKWDAASYSGSGSVWTSNSGGVNATLNGGPAYSSNYGFKLTAGTHSITVPDSVTTRLSTTTARTFQLWFNMTNLPASGSAQLLNKFNASNWDGMYSSVDSQGRVTFTTNGTAIQRTTQTAAAVSANQWTLVTIVTQISSATGSTKIYVNGTERASSAHGSDSFADTSALTVAVDGFNGCVGALYVYEQILTAAEVQTSYDALAAGSVTGACPATYTVTYNGNSNTSGSAPASTTVANGGSFTPAAAGTLARSGYTFTGWNTAANGSGTPFTAGSTTTWNTGANTTLYAQWQTVSYTVTYDGNGNTTGSTPSSGTGSGGSTFTVSGNSGNLVKTGYTFAGWNTAANGGGTNYTAGSGSFTLSANTTLYAKWNANTYTVTYNGNGNTSGSAPSSGSATYGSAFTASGVGSLVKTGFTFAGWNTASSGSDIDVPGGSAATWSIAANTTLYAKWVTASSSSNTGSTTTVNAGAQTASTSTSVTSGGASNAPVTTLAAPLTTDQGMSSIDTLMSTTTIDAGGVASTSTSITAGGAAAPTTTAPESAPVDPDDLESGDNQWALTFVNGERVATTPDVSDGRVSLSVGGASFAIVATDTAGAKLEIDAEGRVILNDSLTFGVSAEGLSADTDYEVWVYSTPQRIAVFRSSVNGTHEGVVTLPEDIEGGWHSIVFVGTTNSDVEVKAAMQVKVPDTDSVVVVAARSWWVWVLLIGAVVFAFLLPGRSRRRQEDSEDSLVV